MTVIQFSCICQPSYFPVGNRTGTPWHHSSPYSISRQRATFGRISLMGSRLNVNSHFLSPSLIFSVSFLLPLSSPSFILLPHPTSDNRFRASMFHFPPLFAGNLSCRSGSNADEQTERWSSVHLSNIWTTFWTVNGSLTSSVCLQSEGCFQDGFEKGLSQHHRVSLPRWPKALARGGQS